VYLDECLPLVAKVGYGALGTGGSLGYEDGVVLVQGRSYARSLSAHAPSLLVFELGARFHGFRCRVAVNDDARDTDADFVVLADGHEAATALAVKPGEPPRPLTAGVAGAHELTLAINTRQWARCHSLWLDPELSDRADSSRFEAVVDCLGGFEITVSPDGVSREMCIVTAARSGGAVALDALLTSVQRHATDVPVVVLAPDDVDAACEQVIARHDSLRVRIRPLIETPDLRGALCSAVRAVEAWRFCCLEVGTIVDGDVRVIFRALDACEDGGILVAAHGRAFAASRGALRRLDDAIQATRIEGGWPARFERALTQLDCAVTLRPEYGVRCGELV
jgi:hypothetical protein